VKPATNAAAAEVAKEPGLDMDAVTDLILAFQSYTGDGNLESFKYFSPCSYLKMSTTDAILLASAAAKLHMMRSK
jgi:hypothetical protein